MYKLALPYLLTWKDFFFGIHSSSTSESVSSSLTVPERDIRNATRIILVAHREVIENIRLFPD